ncbi:MAG: hypothetical protein ACR2FX_02575 [Chthoniobacterales bacterium]
MTALAQECNLYPLRLAEDSFREEEIRRFGSNEFHGGFAEDVAFAGHEVRLNLSASRPQNAQKRLRVFLEWHRLSVTPCTISTGGILSTRRSRDGQKTPRRIPVDANRRRSFVFAVVQPFDTIAHSLQLTSRSFRNGAHTLISRLKPIFSVAPPSERKISGLALLPSRTGSSK